MSYLTHDPDPCCKPVNTAQRLTSGDLESPKIQGVCGMQMACKGALWWCVVWHGGVGGGLGVSGEV